MVAHQMPQRVPRQLSGTRAFSHLLHLHLPCLACLVAGTPCCSPGLNDGSIAFHNHENNMQAQRLESAYVATRVKSGGPDLNFFSLPHTELMRNSHFCYSSPSHLSSQPWNGLLCFLPLFSFCISSCHISVTHNNDLFLYSLAASITSHF